MNFFLRIQFIKDSYELQLVTKNQWFEGVIEEKSNLSFTTVTRI